MGIKSSKEETCSKGWRYWRRAKWCVAIALLLGIFRLVSSFKLAKHVSRNMPPPPHHGWKGKGKPKSFEGKSAIAEPVQEEPLEEIV
jgi:hypothetical protein